MLLWNDKRYHSLDYYFKETYGQKIYKLSLNGGMTCPNRDGTTGTGGCIFCSEGGSGDFAGNALESISTQIETAKSLVHNKMKGGKYIAYFQAFTNTYAPVTYLERIFTEAIMHPDIVAISIATRPDCLPLPVLELLESLNKIKPVYVELGLQTSKEYSSLLINRGYSNDVFESAVDALFKRNIHVIVHIILGLPTETPQDMLKTVDYVCGFPIHGIKLQLLHVLKGTELEKIFLASKEQFTMLEMDKYINILIDCIERIPPQIVLHRITGDGPKNLLIAPLWSTNKKHVLNTIQIELKRRDSYQGKQFIERGKLDAGRSTDAL